MSKMKIELCAASVEAIQLAKEFGIDRIELCQNLEMGGGTPSVGIVGYALALGVETHVLIRPRTGGFLYHREEVNLMEQEVTAYRAMSVHGIVIGALNDFGGVNEQAMKAFVERAEGIPVTFHRAFDDLKDFREGIDRLVELGVQRVLTSGLSKNVDDGLETLCEMLDYAGDRIEVMPGGGIHQGNVRRVIEECSPSSLHFSGTVHKKVDEHSLFADTALKINRKKVEQILAQIM